MGWRTEAQEIKGKYIFRKQKEVMKEREQSREEGKYQEPSFQDWGGNEAEGGYLSTLPGSSSGLSQDRSHRRGCSHSAHCSLAQTCHPVDRGEREMIRSSSSEFHPLLLEFDDKTEPLPHKDAVGTHFLSLGIHTAMKPFQGIL